MFPIKRISDEKINAPYYEEHANLIVVTKDSYFHKFDITQNLREKGILLINTNMTDEEIKEIMKNSEMITG